MVNFIEETHQYINEEGILIPSVSELIRFKFPEQYKDIPEHILKQKASYGISLHATIEEYLSKKATLEEIQGRFIDPNIKIAVGQIDKLLKRHEVKDMEQIVDFEGRYAGTYDICTIEDILIDIKSTSKIHEEWLSWQLGLYYMAKGIEKEYGYCLWLPKGKVGRLVKIKVKSFEKCKELIEEYENKKQPTTN